MKCSSNERWRCPMDFAVLSVTLYNIVWPGGRFLWWSQQRIMRSMSHRNITGFDGNESYECHELKEVFKSHSSVSCCNTTPWVVSIPIQKINAHTRRDSFLPTRKKERYFSWQYSLSIQTKDRPTERKDTHTCQTYAHISTRSGCVPPPQTTRYSRARRPVLFIRKH